MESLKGNSQVPESISSEPTPKELEVELKAIEIWIGIQKAGLNVARQSLSKREERFNSDQKRAKEIRGILGLPP